MRLSSPSMHTVRVNRREFLGAATVAALAIACDRSPSTARSARPNLVFILADDLGYADLSAYGRTDYRTPRIDGLVADGVRFTNAYTAASTCTPTRVAFMTGQYTQRFGRELQVPMGWGTREAGRPAYGLSSAIPTLPSRLKRAGYRTALVGKWHLGFAPEFGPLRHGFDEFFGIKGGGADYFTYTGGDGTADLWEGDAPAERIGYLTELFTEQAVQYVARSHDRPFYLSLHYTAPHWPWEGPRDAHGAEPGHPFVTGGSPAVYAEMVRSLDDGVGRVLDAIDRSGRGENTLVMFASDNGGERYSSNAPWKDGKFTLWEGGIRTPLAMRWPGTLPPGTSCHQLSISMDWTATLLAAAGAVPDSSSRLDGIDLVPFARGDRPPTDRTLFWRQPAWTPPPQPNPARPASQPIHAAARRGAWKYLRVGDDEMLFDLDADPGEIADLKTRSPREFAELREAWHAWSAQMGSG